MEKAPFPHSTYMGESSGGQACLTCHGPSGMQAMAGTAGYHHFMNNDAAAAAQISAGLGNAGDTGRNCLMCHVDHDMFSPFMNPSSPGRSRNLRASAAVLPTANPATWADTDFDPSQAEGGICLSCHRFAQDRAYVLSGLNGRVTAVDRGTYTAATDTHNYEAISYFASDSTAFRANCTKCHDDGRTKIMQSGPAFSLHDSLWAALLPPHSSGFAPDDPPTQSSPNFLEEDSCFSCHGLGSLYAAGPGPDWYGAVSAMPARALNMKAVLTDAALPYRHPVLYARNRHRPSFGNSSNSLPDDLTSPNRHAECADCHNPHVVRPGVRGAAGNDAAQVQAGVWGVEASPKFGLYRAY